MYFPSTAAYKQVDGTQEGFAVLQQGDADLSAVKNMFRVLHEMVQELTPGFHVIVTEHANLDWFQACLAEPPWRDGVRSFHKIGSQRDRLSIWRRTKPQGQPVSPAAGRTPCATCRGFAIEWWAAYMSPPWLRCTRCGFRRDRRRTCLTEFVDQRTCRDFHL